MKFNVSSECMRERIRRQRRQERAARRRAAMRAAIDCVIGLLGMMALGACAVIAMHL